MLSNQPLYKNPQAPMDQRVADLLSQMTLPEKVGQLMQLDGQRIYLDLVKNNHVGSLLHVNGSDADKAIEASLNTRLGIPVLLADDGIHGHSFWAGATIFPTQLAQACSWDTDLMHQSAKVTALEMRATGLKWTFSPVLCLARDLRWGRVDETFGEDPFLIGEFACAMIKGYQGEGLHDPDAVLATAKHFAGYSDTLGGRDASEAEITQRKLRSYFLPPFQRAAEEGAMTFMTGYQSIDGVPSTANKWLLKKVLKEEWGFQGLLVTDWYNVGHLVKDQKICADFAEASALALKSGNDLIMATPEFFEGCQEAVARKLITEAEIDEVVRRVLTLKFSMGLFENPGKGDAVKVQQIINCKTHQELNLRAARESLVLLKNDFINEKPLLPLDASVPKKIALVGPNADNPLAQLGDWSLGSGQMTGPSGDHHPRETIVTPADAMKTLLPQGWEITSAEEADIIIQVLGDDLKYIGEFKSTATLELQDGQIELAEKNLRSGKPVITVLINSKPLVLPDAVLVSGAILEAFNPGMMGGTAIVEAIFGVINPAGKLTISFPRHAGQLPVYYNSTRGQHGIRYADLTQEPLFAFGFGMSYTKFSYKQPSLISASELNQSDTLEVETEVANTGEREGVEIVQLYIEDEVTSMTWAKRELKAYKRICLKAKESKTLRFSIPVENFWIVDAQGNKIVEPGNFKILIGSSSRDCDLKCLQFSVKA